MNASNCAGAKRIRFEFAEPPRSGDDVLTFNALGKLWPLPEGEDKQVLSNVSGLVRRGEKIAVVGVNGAGKSTFLKLLHGDTEPTSGDVTVGANVHTGYFSQHSMEVLDPSKTVFETVQDALPQLTLGVLRNLCAHFCFRAMMWINVWISCPVGKSRVCAGHVTRSTTQPADP